MSDRRGTMSAGRGSERLAAGALRLKWKARGLAEDVLLAIQREVCSVQPEP